MTDPLMPELMPELMPKLMPETDDVWSALKAATANTVEQWLIGLRHNKSAPDDILIELLDLNATGRHC